MVDGWLGRAKDQLLHGRWLTEFTERARFELLHPPDGPVIDVHAMAGAGAAAVHDALLAHYPRSSIYHTCYLSQPTIREFHERYARLHENTHGASGLDEEFLAARYLAGALHRGVRAKWRVVTLVREPVTRTIAAFFRRFPLNHPGLDAHFHEDPDNAGRLIELFLDPGEQERQVISEWFDREVKATLDIEVFASPFPVADGCATFHSAVCDLLLLRYKDLGTRGGEALRRFLGAEALEVTTAAGDVEPWAEARERFEAEIQLPPAWLDALLESHFARHFYTPDERAAFRAHWSRD